MIHIENIAIKLGFYAHVIFLGLCIITCHFSDIQNVYDPLGVECKQWGQQAHPLTYVLDSDPSTYWLSRASLPSVEITFDLKQIYKVSNV